MQFVYRAIQATFDAGAGLQKMRPKKQAMHALPQEAEDDGEKSAGG